MGIYTDYDKLLHPGSSHESTLSKAKVQVVGVQALSWDMMHACTDQEDPASDPGTTT